MSLNNIEANEVILNSVRGRWRGFITSLNEARHIQILLRSSCEPAQLEGWVLTLKFYHAFHKESLERYPACRLYIQKKLQAYFAMPFVICFKLKDEEAKC